MPDLVALASHAPPWVRLVLSALALLWALATAVTTALRAVPEERYVAVERLLPRLGQLLRAARKFGTDVLPFFAALGAALVGLPVRPAQPPADPPRSSGQSGRASVALLVMVVLAAALMLVIGCPAVTEGVMRVAPGVPDPSDCNPGQQYCQTLPADAGVMPVVCSSTRRPWPALPRRADGTQRVCPGGCQITDAGVAHCTAVDGGAR